MSGHRGGRHACPHVHARRAERGGDLLGGERLLAREQPRQGREQRHARSGRGVRLRHLDPDHAAPEDRQPLGDHRAGRRLPVGPRSRLGEAADGRDHGFGPDSDHDRLPRDQELLGDANAPWPVESPEPAHERDPALLEPRQLMRVVETVDDPVAAPQDRLDVDRVVDDLACARYPARFREDLRRPQQRLRRHACVERALAPHEVRLHDRDVVAALREAPGQYLAGRPRPDDDDVERAHRHDPTLLSPASGTGMTRMPCQNAT